MWMCTYLHAIVHVEYVGTKKIVTYTAIFVLAKPWKIPVFMWPYTEIISIQFACTSCKATNFFAMIITPVLYDYYVYKRI